MDANTLIDLIEGAGFEARSYSGRGMYGKKCVGFTVEGSVFEAISNLIESANGGGDGRTEAYERIMELNRAIFDAKDDSMGLGTIIYFPCIEWQEEE